VKTSRNLYFIGPLADWFLLGGGSLALYALSFAPSLQVLEMISHQLGIWLLLTINYPHFSATVHRLYRSRENVAQYPAATIALPLLLIALVAAALREGGQTLTPVIARIFSLWSPLHYCGQALGVALILAHRSGVRIQRWERFALSSMLVSSYLYSSSLSESRRGIAFYAGISYPTFNLSAGVVSVALACLSLSSAVFAVVMIRKAFSEKEKLPPIFYLTPACQIIWSVVSVGTPNYTTLIPIFHAMQYMPIVWFMHLKESTKNLAPQTLSRREIRRISAVWFLKNLAGGAALFFLLPYGIAVVFGLNLTLVQAVVWATINLHHFLIDGIIWKLRRPKVHAPLMGSVFARAPAAVPA